MLRFRRQSGKTVIFVKHSIQKAVSLVAILTAGPTPRGALT